jgi:RNA polymerase sigma-70 factor (ECF subfamily)
LALSELDRSLIETCVSGDAQAWRTFCDRFAGLVQDVVTDSIRLAQVGDSVVESFFKKLRSNQFELLREFRGKSSLASYLAVLSRRHALVSLATTKWSDGNG